MFPAPACRRQIGAPREGSATCIIDRRRGQKGEIEMSILHQVVPMFILIQFAVALIGITAAMLSAGREY